MKKPKLRFTEGQDAFAVIAGDVFMPAVLQVQKFHIVQVVRDSHYLVKEPATQVRRSTPFLTSVCSKPKNPRTCGSPPTPE